ncbi:MAG: ribonuclease III [Saprospiraceae bacterium]|nr:ribonuclease III [Saprospiraceae bacterium]MBK8825898.1 ribonuclease III [Saprospiraceae bacterium]MBK9582916.1 ribonuclease III [Saprospiraceae bacterium]MBK9744298.1 ribonuclease III [Saprospiraceae bacterium]MBP9056007.1 ribonuclease III [Saprospiraceae bacterium]
MRLRPILGFTPARLNLFKTAFYHKSMTNETPGKATNERLEYLGDAILSTIVAEYLFKKYPNKDEGFLTKMRSKIVKRQTLNEIADNMGLDVILAEYSMGKMSNSMLGNALEALVGAIYIEFGYEKTKTYVIKNILMKYLNINDLETRDDNHKSQLLEWCQKNGKDINFATLSKFKLDKRDCFKVAIVIDGVEISTAEDFNKKSAEQTAANRAIEKLMIQNTLT